MRDGLYEKILDNRSKKELGNKQHTEIRNIDNSEISKVLSITYEKTIREILSGKDNIDKLKFIEDLNKATGIQGFDYNDKKFQELLAIHTEKNILIN